MINTGSRFHVSMPEPHKHLFHVTLELNNLDGISQEVYLPVWTPGSYLIREYAKNVFIISACDGKKNLEIHKTRKNIWLVELDGSTSVSIVYQVYAFEQTVRNCFLNTDQGMIQGAGLFLAPKNFENQPFHIFIEKPEHWSTITTVLPAVQGSDHEFTAENYTELLDSPIAIGNHILYPFMTTGTPHQFAVIGSGNYDMQKIIRDTRRTLTVTHAMFGIVPYDRYTFFLTTVNSGYGGLEHKNCASMIFSRHRFINRTDYIKFMGLVSHEFFHCFNVKRIHPQDFHTIDLHNENYTRLHWVTEGITSYYDNFLLRRSKVITVQEYLNLLKADIRKMLATPGRLHQSIKNSSFDTWIKHYRQDEHSVNAHISYYLKGSLIGLALDLTIRRITEGKKTLDDVFRILWREFRKTGDGYTEESFKEICETTAGEPLNDVWKYLESLEEMDLDAVLNPFGICLQYNNIDPNHPKPWLGMELKESEMVITKVLADAPAENCGLNVHDEIISVNGIRLYKHNYMKRLLELKVNEPADLLISRDGLLRTIQLIPLPKPPEVTGLVKVQNPNETQKALFRSWLLLEWDQDLNARDD